MRYWLWNWVWFPIRHPRKFLCDQGIRLCGREDCGNIVWYRARNVKRFKEAQRMAVLND